MAAFFLLLAPIFNLRKQAHGVKVEFLAVNEFLYFVLVKQALISVSMESMLLGSEVVSKDFREMCLPLASQECGRGRWLGQKAVNEEKDLAVPRFILSLISNIQLHRDLTLKLQLQLSFKLFWREV